VVVVVVVVAAVLVEVTVDEVVEVLLGVVEVVLVAQEASISDVTIRILKINHPILFFNFISPSCQYIFLSESSV